MIKNEWKNLLKNKMLVVVVMAIIIIPVIYAGLFLKSMWDPYGSLDNLPVAVVNNDKSVEYEGKTLSVGSDMEDALRDNDSLDFHFVDSKDAEQGLRNGTYYMVITIPEDFSENASTLMDEKPKKMELEYETNPGTNYIASKMSESAVVKIRDEVASQVTETYTQTVFDQITEVGDGMQEAADGSKELKDGLGDASDGNKTITDNLKKLADSTLTFKDGANTLTEGLKEYTDGVAQVDDGATQLNDGVGTLTAKVPELTAGVNKLNQGVKDYTDGVAKLDANSAQLTAGTADLQEGAETLKKGLDTLKDGNYTVCKRSKYSCRRSDTVCCRSRSACSRSKTAFTTGGNRSGIFRHFTVEQFYFQRRGLSEIRDSAAGIRFRRTVRTVKRAWRKPDSRKY